MGIFFANGYIFVNIPKKKTNAPHANINSIRQPFTPPISVLLHLIEYRGNVYIQICLQ